MNALQVATQVAAHPAMVKLRAQQEVMRRRMVRDYGDDFMLGGSELPEMTLQNGRTSKRFAGVHFWTAQQRIEWFNIAQHMQNARKALKSVYEAV